MSDPKKEEVLHLQARMKRLTKELERNRVELEHRNGCLIANQNDIHKLEVIIIRLRADLRAERAIRRRDAVEVVVHIDPGGRLIDP